MTGKVNAKNNIHKYFKKNDGARVPQNRSTRFTPEAVALGLPQMIIRWDALRLRTKRKGSQRQYRAINLNSHKFTGNRSSCTCNFMLCRVRRVGELSYRICVI